MEIMLHNDEVALMSPKSIFGVQTTRKLVLWVLYKLTFQTAISVNNYMHR